jgi:hypothetical protein
MTPEQETAAEVAHWEPVERYIRELLSTQWGTPNERTLVAGNIRGFVSWARKEGVVL